MLAQGKFNIYDILLYLFPLLSGERAKYLSEFYEFSLRSNPWHTFDGRLSAASEIRIWVLEYKRHKGFPTYDGKPS